MLDLISSLFLERPRYNWRVASGARDGSEILPRKLTEAGANRIAKKRGVRLVKIILPQTALQEFVEMSIAFLAAYAVALPLFVGAYLLAMFLKHG